MGLGKTAQSISTLEFQRQLCDIPGPFLIVAPLTTLGHWQREVETWTSMVRSATHPLSAVLCCAGLCCEAETQRWNCDTVYWGPVRGDKDVPGLAVLCCAALHATPKGA